MADEYNFQIPKEGFDSYLYGIIPEDQAVLAGAFGVSMQQIKNINEVDPKTFAKVVYSLETNNGLNLTNGTNVPAETFKVDAALSRVALGSGLYGTYTHSDFIGSMTALPYPLQDIYNGIKELQTERLIEIYKEIWSLCTYSRAIVNLTFSQFDDFNNPLPPEEFRITGVSILYPGGGYDPDNPPLIKQEQAQPTVAIGTTTVGNDPNDPATYRRIKSVSLDPFYQNKIITGALIPRVEPNPPDDAFGPITDFWFERNERINELIIEADAEIQNILSSSTENFNKAKLLNANWNALGTALKIEQRARYTAIPPVPIPRDPWLALYPTALYNFVDSIPDYAGNTMPHGPAQSLEMIDDMCSTCGHSIIGLMRESRNQDRLAEAGIPLDNTIPNTLSDEDVSALIGNGTKCGAVPGSGITAENGLTFSMPAFALTQNCDGDQMKPDKNTFFDCTERSLRRTETKISGSIQPLLQDPDCCTVAGPEIPVGPSTLLGTGIPNFITGEEGNVLPNTLNIDFISGVLLPSQFNINDAIDKVIECNCDCWIN
jgi:hypothetical protein